MIRTLFSAVLVCSLLVAPIGRASEGAVPDLAPLAKGQQIPQPDWFKDSFLDLAEDIEEAAGEQRRLVLYFHQAGCPYCYNLITRVFPEPEINRLMQENFDLVAFDLWGDRLVTLPDGSEISEKELAVRLRVQYTPTLIFLSEDGTPVLRLDGYRPAEAFKQNLIELLHKPVTSRAIAAGAEQITLRGDKPFAIQFQDAGCSACAAFKRDILSRDDTTELLQGFNLIQIDLSENPTLVFPDGHRVAAVDLARQLRLSYFPSWQLLDSSGQQWLKIDAYVRAFHFNAALEYVADRVYLRQPEFQRYINERGDRLRAEGKTVDILQ